MREREREWESDDDDDEESSDDNIRRLGYFGWFLSFFFVPLVVPLGSYSRPSNVTLNYIFLLLLLAHFISVVAVAAALVPDCCCNICWITRARFDLAFCSCLLFFALSSIASPEGNYVPRRKHMQAHTHTHTHLWANTNEMRESERRRKRRKEKIRLAVTHRLSVFH